MTTISLIAAIDEAQGLGFQNKLLCHLPADLQHFKAITLGKPIIMGRNTFESIGKPLPGRLNIVISKTMQPREGIEVVNSLEEALTKVQQIPEIMIIGGAVLFNQTISIANRIYLTVIHNRFKSDVFFPTIDKTVWTCTSSHLKEKDEKNAFDMTFYIFERLSKIL